MLGGKRGFLTQMRLQCDLNLGAQYAPVILGQLADTFHQVNRQAQRHRLYGFAARGIAVALGVQAVEGVKRVSQMTEGLGGEFTYCPLLYLLHI